MVKRIYETMIGVLVDEACVPYVTNEFAAGMPCAKLYKDIYEAYQRVVGRLNCSEEDGDVEIIVDSFLQMQQILCHRMFYYGQAIRNDPECGSADMLERLD